MAKVEFLFDFGSPNAYLAHLVIPEIEERTKVKFNYVPILLGGVFKLTNNSSPAEKLAGVKNRLQYEHLELQRFIRRHAVDHARRHCCTARRRLRPLCRRNVQAHVG
jgi:2-hydroxychromene-2-carboxylate isomerase